MKKILCAFIVALIVSKTTEAQSWTITGNVGTNATNNFIGTTDNVSLKIRTNNITRMFIHSSGRVGLGTSTPGYPLDVKTGSINSDSLYRLNGTRILYRTLNSNLALGNAGTLTMSGSGNTLVGEGAGTSVTTSNNNTLIGRNAGAICNGNSNTIVGRSAAYTLSTGVNNCALGMNAIYNGNTGSSNIAVGAYTLYYNSSKSGNVAVGDSALHYNNWTSANPWEATENVAVGQLALKNNTSGFYNTALGSKTLLVNTTGFANTAVGYVCMAATSSGIYNTAMGYSALQSNTTGNRNVSIGYGTGTGIVNTEGNTYIGTYATGGSFTNSSALCYNAYVDANNKIRLGNSSITSIGGQVGFTSFSDARIKNNVQQNVPGLEFINLLRPVTFHYDVRKTDALLGVNNDVELQGKYDIEKIQFTGFLAQEVAAAAHQINYDFSGVDNTGNVMGLRYSEFAAPLVKAVQQLDSQNKELREQLQEQQMMIEQLREMVMNSKNESKENGNLLLKLQNDPNPFSGSTYIQYSIGKKYSDAKIVITNQAGVQLHSIVVKNSIGTVEFDASSMSAGQYFYSLIIDGTVAMKKTMTLVK